MAKRRLARRHKLLELRGNRCIKCGTNDNLEFDHRDRTIKRFNLSGCHLDKSWESILIELEKCDLLCNKCHNIKSTESGDNGAVSHGAGLSGKKSCFCHLCKPLKRQYMANYRAINGRKN